MYSSSYLQLCISQVSHVKSGCTGAPPTAQRCAACNVQHMLLTCTNWICVFITQFWFVAAQIFLILHYTPLLIPLLSPPLHLALVVFVVCATAAKCLWPLQSGLAYNSLFLVAFTCARTAHAICCVAVAVASPDQLPAEGGGGQPTMKRVVDNICLHKYENRQLPSVSHCPPPMLSTSAH